MAIGSMEVDAGKQERKVVRVRCSDGVELEVEEMVAMEFEATKKMMEDGSIDIITFGEVESEILLKVIEFTRKRVDARGCVVPLEVAAAAAAAGEPTDVGAVADAVAELKGVGTAEDALVQPTSAVKPFADEHAAFDSFFSETDMDVLFDAVTELGCKDLEDMCHLKRTMDFARWDEKILLRCNDGAKLSVEKAVAMEIPVIRDMMVSGATDILIPDLPGSKMLKKAIQYCRKIARTRNRRNPLSLECVAPPESAISELDTFIGSLVRVDFFSLLLLRTTAQCLGLKELKAEANKAIKACKNDLPDENVLFLRCHDDYVVLVEETVAMESRTIQRLFLESDENDNVIPLPDISFNILNLVMDFCKEHVNARRLELEVDAFDAAFIMVDSVTLFDLIMAANYLEVKKLIDLTGKAFMVMAAPPIRARNWALCNNESLTGCTEAGAETNNFVILRSMEGEVFEVELATAMESGTIRRRVQDGFSSQVILLPTIPSKILHRVLLHCRKCADRHNGSASEKAKLSDVELEIFSLDRQTVSELQVAAVSLDTKELKQLTSCVIRVIDQRDWFIDESERVAKLSKELGVVLPHGIFYPELSIAIALYEAAGAVYQPPANFPQGLGLYGMSIDRQNAVLAGIYRICLAVRYSVITQENIPLGLRFKDFSFVDRLLERAKELQDEIRGWGGQPLPLPPELEEPLPLPPAT